MTSLSPVEISVVEPMCRYKCSRGYIIEVYRGKRGGKESEFLGTLVRRARYDRLPEPEQQIEITFTRKAGRLFTYHMNKGR